MESDSKPIPPEITCIAILDYLDRRGLSICEYSDYDVPESHKCPEHQ